MSATRGTAAAGGRYESTGLQHETTGDKQAVSLRFRSQGDPPGVLVLVTATCLRDARCARAVLAALRKTVSRRNKNVATGVTHFFVLLIDVQQRTADLEAAFLVEQAQDRRTVLACLFCFDILTFVVRSLQLLTHKGQHRSWATFVPQMVNMSILWAVIYCINQRSRRSHGKLSAALQEEVLLSSAVALAVTSLLLNLQKGSGQDYAFACFFLISATLLLRVRWFLGAAILAVPVIAVFSAPLWGSDLPHVLPGDAELHLTIAWALGALIAYLAEDQRRQMFVRSGTTLGKGLSSSLGWEERGRHSMIAA